MNLLYKFFETFGITNIGLCIIVFTIVVKMIMFPLTLKQQKFTKTVAFSKTMCYNQYNLY